MEFDNIIKLIKEVSDSELTQFAFEEGNVKISMKKNVKVVEQAAMPTVVSQPVSINVKDETTVEDDSKYEYVKSPIVGTFYASRSEGGEPLVNAGDIVSEKSVIGIVEAMKLMNEIEAGISGKVVEVLVKNGQVVEYGQKLVKIEK